MTTTTMSLAQAVKKVTKIQKKMESTTFQVTAQFHTGTQNIDDLNKKTLYDQLKLRRTQSMMICTLKGMIRTANEAVGINHLMDQIAENKTDRKFVESLIPQIERLSRTATNKQAVKDMLEEAAALRAADPTKVFRHKTVDVMLADEEFREHLKLVLAELEERGEKLVDERNRLNHEATITLSETEAKWLSESLG